MTAILAAFWALRGLLLFIALLLGGAIVYVSHMEA